MAYPAPTLYPGMLLYPSGPDQSLQFTYDGPPSRFTYAETYVPPSEPVTGTTG